MDEGFLEMETGSWLWGSSLSCKEHWVAIGKNPLQAMGRGDSDKIPAKPYMNCSPFPFIGGSCDINET